MAWRWRIRHKLMLGLALVISILALLLGGTLKGLAAYRATINNIDAKLIELEAAQKFKNAVRDLMIPPEDRHAADKAAEMHRKVQIARGLLGEYQKCLQSTLEHDRDPTGAYDQKNRVTDIQADLAKLDEAIDLCEKPGARPLGSSELLVDQAPVKAASVELMRAADELPESIYGVLYKSILQKAKQSYRLTLATVVSITVLGVLLMVSLLRFFYRWTFNPLRDLQAGVGRVGQGDFEHPIDVHSSDEMQELAEAFNDMTRRLREMYGDLARQVNERSRQLVRSERLAGVGFLAAGVAHEINNPLASITFCSEALERRLADLIGRPEPAASVSLQLRAVGGEEGDRETVFKYLKMVQDEAFRCKKITERLLEFSRGGERTREPADLAEIIQSVIDVSQHLPSFKGKTIDFPGGRVTAWVNAQEIKSVVLNMVVNALDSMDEGGTLSIRLNEHDGLGEMQFTDTGCGMPADVLENIFEPFFTKSRTGKGTGLGLSISHRVISQHGGEIEASSDGPGHGSTFTVRIPLQPAAENQEEPPAPRAAA